MCDAWPAQIRSGLFQNARRLLGDGPKKRRISLLPTLNPTSYGESSGWLVFSSKGPKSISGAFDASVSKTTLKLEAKSSLCDTASDSSSSLGALACIGLPQFSLRTLANQFESRMSLKWHQCWSTVWSPVAHYEGTHSTNTSQKCF